MPKIEHNDVRLVFAEIMSQTIKGAKTKKIMLSSRSLRRRHETIFFLSYDASLILGTGGWEIELEQSEGFGVK